MTFDKILPYLKRGDKVRRAAWEEKQVLTGLNLFGRPTLFLGNFDFRGGMAALVGDDVFSDDWEVVYRDVMEADAESEPMLELEMVKPEEGAP